MYNYNQAFSEFAQYKRIKEEAEAALKAIQAGILEYMSAEGVTALQGNEHKCSLTVYDRRVTDNKRLEAIYPDIYKELTETKQSQRFNFS